MYEMASQQVLQTVDLNSRDMDLPPARKRARYESPKKGRWSLTGSTLNLDEVYDYGLAVLESDSDVQSEGEDCNNEQSTVDLTCKKESSEVSCSSVKSRSDEFSIEEWDSFLIKKPDQSDPAVLDYFSMLCDEVLLHIFHFLPKNELTRVASVCHRFHRITKDESLWARMDIGNRTLGPGGLGHIIGRQVVILRLAQSEVGHPPIVPQCRAGLPDFQSRLMYLDLSMAHISIGSMVELFGKCQRLKKLSLEQVMINNDVMQAMSGNKELEVLNLSMAMGVELTGLRYILGKCYRLRELNISWTYLSASTINYLCSHLPSTVDRLNVAGCRKLLTDRNVMDLVRCCPGLRELDLSDCTGLSGHSIGFIMSLRELNFLALSRCYFIPYTSLLQLKTLQSLMFLDVHGGYVELAEMRAIEEALGPRVQINKFKFSSVARPTVGSKRSSIWNLRVRD